MSNNEIIDLRDELGRYRTASLFKESYVSHVSKEKYPPLFTLKPRDTDGLLSMGKIFIDLEDPTGYQVAIKLLGSYDHWKELCKAKWFIPYLQAWEEELEIKLQSQALVKIKEIASGDTSQSIQAAKFLNDKGWKPKRGRPSKEEREHAMKLTTRLEEAVSEDLERIRLVK
jgi:hypothetical protein